MSDMSSDDLDEHIPELAAGIINNIGISPPETADALRPPNIRYVRSSSAGTKSYTVVAGGTPTVVLGRDTYKALRMFCRAAATYFLPAGTSDERPSRYWSEAKRAVATCLDWSTSPADDPLYRDFPLSGRQAHVGDAFAAYSYRFLLCHEMAHVALEHLEGLDTSTDKETVYRASQEKEIEADRFALTLQVRSLPDPSQTVTALAAPMYWLRFNELFDGYRLALLAHLVDEHAWDIEYSHPPVLRRLLGLMGAAQGLAGPEAVDGVNRAYYDLNGPVNEIWETARLNQEHVAERVALVLTQQSDVSELSTLFQESPLGVLRGLDWAQGWDTPSRAAVAAATVEHAIRALPPEFQEFLTASRADRARLLA